MSVVKMILTLSLTPTTKHTLKILKEKIVEWKKDALQPQTLSSMCHPQASFLAEDGGKVAIVSTLIFGTFCD